MMRLMRVNYCWVLVVHGRAFLCVCIRKSDFKDELLMLGVSLAQSRSKNHAETMSLFSALRCR
jgi:hypothetical protein